MHYNFLHRPPPDPPKHLQDFHKHKNCQHWHLNGSKLIPLPKRPILTDLYNFLKSIVISLALYSIDHTMISLKIQPMGIK